MNNRTDLAVEEMEYNENQVEDLPGVTCKRETDQGFTVTSVQISDSISASCLHKPMGNYITMDLDELFKRSDRAFLRGCEVLSEQLKMVSKLSDSDSILLVGLGNKAITPDSIGPATIESVLVTRHLVSMVPEYFSGFRSVSSICSGVLGTTGFESGELVSSICEHFHPDAVIVIDALASRETRRLCKSIQITDSGIIPGSGVNNAREEISSRSLGIPVTAIGVPTVVDAATLALHFLKDAGLYHGDHIHIDSSGLIVTPSDIDEKVRDISKLIAYGINMALHRNLTIEDIDMLIS